LDGLNVHARNFFRLYPEGQDRGVECSFDPSLFKVVHAAVGHRVRVSGLIVRDPNGVTISSVGKVTEVTTLPPASELPPLSSLFGLFKNSPIDREVSKSGWAS
ncbi:MAG: hypothetical protein WBD31_25235, partial [Rubripirellula sp.]